MVSDQVEGAANEGIGRVESAFGDLAGDRGAQVKGKINQAKGAAQKAYGEARDRAEDVLSRTRDKGGDVYDAAMEYVREYPLLGVAAGLAAGLLLGLVLRGGSRRED